MRTMLLVALLTSLMMLPIGAGDEPPKSDGRQALQRVLDDQVVAWNKGDLEGFMRGYWQSPELSFFSGANKTSGWQATLERYRKKYQGEGKEMGKLAFREISIDLLGADHALVKGRWQLTLKNETPGGLFTLICRKMTVGWRIVHDHTSS